jgi:uncharacterized membrane protein YfcA
MDWAYAVAGLVVGFMVGMTGLGGGSLMTPLLVLVFGIPPATAVGTDLVYASITNVGGAWVHNRKGNVNWKIVGWLAAGSLPTAALTASLLVALDARDERLLSTVINSVLGIALMLTALALLFRERLSRLRRVPVGVDHIRPSPYVVPATIASGMFLGVIVTISSVGAGAMGMVALLWLYPRLRSIKLVGVDISHAVPLTAVAGLGHFYMGTVDVALLGSLLLGSLPGIYLASHVGNMFPDRIMRPTVACMLLFMGGRLVF